MIKSLKLGDKLFPSNLIQGPLAGVSCAPFRRLTWRYSEPAFSCTEMISCKTLLHQPASSMQRYIKKDPQEGPVCFQLSGNDPNEVGEAARKASQLGADLIDLNCGCPVNKIRKKGAGSKLLSDAGKLYQLITAMKKNTTVPVSVKIRVDAGKDSFNAEIVKVVTDAGLDFLVVHGRHWTEHYETACRYDQIQYFVENLKIPVIGNGDIACIESLRKMLATGCAGVMIGRAGVGQPWLIARLRSEIQDEKFTIPVWAERADIFIEHVESLIELLESEKFAILQARQLGKYYARGLQEKAAFCAALNECDNLVRLKEMCQKFFR